MRFEVLGEDDYTADKKPIPETELRAWLAPNPSPLKHNSTTAKGASKSEQSTYLTDAEMQQMSTTERGTTFELHVLQFLRRFRFTIERTGRAGDGS
jgi:hypothetical protein